MDLRAAARVSRISQREANYIRNKVGSILDKVAEVFCRNSDMENAFSKPSIGDYSLCLQWKSIAVVRVMEQKMTPNIARSPLGIDYDI